LSGIAKAVRGTLNGHWIRIPGPGHRESDDSLGFRLDPAAPGGFWVHTFAEDDPAECRAYVKQLLAAVNKGGLIAPEGLEQSRGKSDQAASTARALALWEQAQAPEGSLVETYLRTRGCELPPFAASVLRFHLACPFSGGFRFPAMIALMRDVSTGEPRGVHRTALSDDGKSKRSMPDGISPKRMLGPAKNAAAMLMPLAAKMGIAEGIETALSASKLFGLPVWALLSAGGIGTFPVLTGISDLTIFADNDKAGWSAAEKCGVRYQRSGIGGRLQYPPEFGDDWNDVVKEHKYGLSTEKDQA
jgi:hypothetical protein